MLFHLIYCSTCDILRQAYYSLVETYIRHPITARGSSTHCRILQTTQYQILKTFLKNSHFLNRTNRKNHSIQNNSNTIQRNTTKYGNTSNNFSVPFILLHNTSFNINNNPQTSYNLQTLTITNNKQQ